MSFPHRPAISLARKLRKDQTDTERKLWSLLKSRSLLGYKFRRQRPIGLYVVDFCCMKPRLIIEADGAQHSRKSDEEVTRTSFLEKRGFLVIRFWDNDILLRPNAVLEGIIQALNTLTLPSPRMGEGKSR